MRREARSGRRRYVHFYNRLKGSGANTVVAPAGMGQPRHRQEVVPVPAQPRPPVIHSQGPERHAKGHRRLGRGEEVLGQLPRADDQA